LFISAIPNLKIRLYQYKRKSTNLLEDLLLNEYDDGSEPDFFPGHPVMTYGVDSDGDEIEPDVVEERLGEPNDPFPTGQL